MNPRDQSFQNYGGRGISVCDRWRDSFEAFYADMGGRPTARHSIERIDNDGHYEPGNCRWAEIRDQLRNRRTNHVLTHLGQTLTVTDWAALIGIAATTLTARLDRGWSVEEALTTPGDEGSRKKQAHRLIEFRGETLSIAEWTRRLRAGPNTIHLRLKAGWTVERALTTPVSFS